MKRLSLTRAYFLCAVYNKGEILLSTEQAPACLIVSEMLELISHEYVARKEKDMITVVKPWDNAIPYLKPLYDSIRSLKKPKNAVELAEVLLSDDKMMQKVQASIGNFVVANGDADEVVHRGVFREKTKYIPKEEAIKRITDEVRSEFDNTENISEDIYILALILDKSQLLNKFFNKDESIKIRKFLKDSRYSDTYTSIKDILDDIEVIDNWIDAVTAAMLASI